MKILPFTEDNLLNSFINKYTNKDAITKKRHFSYFINYLGPNGLNAATIIIEDNYVSKDFLDDFTYYYATCHEDYSKYCKRVHFFSSPFTTEEFTQNLISSDENQNFWDSYLGFIVIKPIPLTFIGFTVLKTYSESSSFNERNFWGVRKYKIHLYGKELTINSLAFQEQDSVLAACATTAIWSMLNKASIDFHTILKSPGQITKDAGDVSYDGSRLFPNDGLNLLQICQAIYNSGLVSEIKQDNVPISDDQGRHVFNVVSNEYTKKIINAYSSIGIPIILVIYVPNGGRHGLHAITVSGYKKQPPISIAPQNGISWLSSNIEKIYAHDDQWGPFVRISFNGDVEIETPWSNTSNPPIPTYISSIVVPLYPKVRISYENIESITLGLDRILSFVFNDQNIADLVWDIKLLFSEGYKTYILSSELDDDDKMKILEKSLPKYLWIASCYIGDYRIFDFTFDATNVKHAMIGVDVVCFINDSFKPTLVSYLETNRTILEPLIPIQSSSYYSFLIDNLK